MTMLARIEASDADADRRWSNRRLLTLQVPGAVPDQPGADVLVHDLSLTGLLIETSAELADGACLEIDLPQAGPTVASVMWGTGRFYGCRFDTPIGARALSAALLKDPLGPAAAPPPETPPAAKAPTAQAVDRPPPPTRKRLIGAMALAGWLLVLMPILVASRLLS